MAKQWTGIVTIPAHITTPIEVNDLGFTPKGLWVRYAHHDGNVQYNSIGAAGPTDEKSAALTIGLADYTEDEEGVGEQMTYGKTDQPGLIDTPALVLMLDSFDVNGFTIHAITNMGEDEKVILAFAHD
jgi:hypothetical protein